MTLLQELNVLNDTVLAITESFEKFKIANIIATKMRFILIIIYL